MSWVILSLRVLGLSFFLYAIQKLTLNFYNSVILICPKLETVQCQPLHIWNDKGPTLVQMSVQPRYNLAPFFWTLPGLPSAPLSPVTLQDKLKFCFIKKSFLILTWLGPWWLLRNFYPLLVLLVSVIMQRKHPLGNCLLKGRNNRLLREI